MKSQLHQWNGQLDLGATGKRQTIITVHLPAGATEDEAYAAISQKAAEYYGNSRILEIWKSEEEEES